MLFGDGGPCCKDGPIHGSAMSVLWRGGDACLWGGVSQMDAVPVPTQSQAPLGTLIRRRLWRVLQRTVRVIVLEQGTLFPL